VRPGISINGGPGVHRHTRRVRIPDVTVRENTGLALVPRHLMRYFFTDLMGCCKSTLAHPLVTAP
jgi:adenosyl cobinamide kinase/adenosyl cobinamide phosphate guanylyltransferase